MLPIDININEDDDGFPYSMRGKKLRVNFDFAGINLPEKVNSVVTEALENKWPFAMHEDKNGIIFFTSELVALVYVDGKLESKETFPGLPEFIARIGLAAVAYKRADLLPNNVLSMFAPKKLNF